MKRKIKAIAVATAFSIIPMFASCCVGKEEQSGEKQNSLQNSNNVDPLSSFDTSNIVHLSDREILINDEKYTITFSDDFDGKSLDKKKWEYCPQQKRGDIGGKWSNRMTSLDGNGNLVLTSSLKKNIFTGKYTPLSAGIRSKGKFEQCKGYFEIRCKVQNARGFWSAFWLMCDDVKNIGNGAINGAEIDIFEAYNVVNGSINHAIHWDGYGADHKCISESKTCMGCYNDEYHIYSLLWNDDGYFFYIDGKNSYSITKSTPDFPGICEVPTYLKITSEFGTWAGEYDEKELPDSVYVDYVKVYKKS